MSISRRVKDWLALPEIETATFECSDCGAPLDASDPACPDPECGGKPVRVDLDPRYLYWDPMM